MIDKILTRTGIGIALFFMVLELTYINAKSLLYIVDEFGRIDKFFAIVGAMAFSMVTILVMRRSNNKWMKVVFPIFDAALVFCGFNLKFSHNLLNNPVAFGLTIFMAVFTGLIMFSLGYINYNNKHDEDIAVKDVRIRLLETELGRLMVSNNSLINELDTVKTELKAIQGLYEKKESEFDDLQTEFTNKEGWLNEALKQNEHLKTKLEEYETKLDVMRTDYGKVANIAISLETQLKESEKYKAVYYASEKSRILKKSEKNRTNEELELLEIANAYEHTN